MCLFLRAKQNRVCRVVVLPVVTSLDVVVGLAAGGSDAPFWGGKWPAEIQPSFVSISYLTSSNSWFSQMRRSFRTCAHPGLELHCDFSHLLEILSVVKVLLVRLRGDLPQLLLYGFANTHGVYGDP